MKKKTTVAAMRRRTKKPTNMTAKMTASDIASQPPLEPLLDLKPRLDKSEIAFDPLNHHLGPYVD